VHCDAVRPSQHSTPYVSSPRVPPASHTSSHGPRAPPPTLYAGHYYNRVTVLWLGCTIWGFFTICFSLTTTVRQGILTWALNGVGLALMIPNAQSMVADYYSADTRGSAFGMMCLTSATGAMVGALYATNIGGLPACLVAWLVAWLAG
jgi:MFS family permease